MVVCWFTAIAPIAEPPACLESAVRSSSAISESAAIVLEFRRMQCNDFVGLLERMQTRLTSNLSSVIMYAGDGRSSDRLVAWQLPQLNGPFEEKIWVRYGGKVTLFENGLEFNVRVSMENKKWFVSVRPVTDQPMDWFALDKPERVSINRYNNQAQPMYYINRWYRDEFNRGLYPLLSRFGL